MDDEFSSLLPALLSFDSFIVLQAGAKGEESRKLLDNVWGEVPAKETTAVMGPSGAGKTSLLNILAGRASTHGRVTIESDVRLNNYSVDPTNINVRKQIAFVAQDDSLQVTATPREAIRFSAKLRLPRSTADHQLEKLTNRMITELGKKKWRHEESGVACRRDANDCDTCALLQDLPTAPTLLLAVPLSRVFLEERESAQVWVWNLWLSQPLSFLTNQLVVCAH